MTRAPSRSGGPSGEKKPLRVAFLITHPIQYATPLFQRLAEERDLAFTVIYQTDLSTGEYMDEGFGRAITWDIPLLEGHDSVFAPTTIGPRDKVTLWWPFPVGLGRLLRRLRVEWLIVHCYSRPSHWLAILEARLSGIKVLIRDEATPISRPRGPIKRFLKRLFFWGLDRAASGFLAIGSLNAAYYRAHGISEGKIFSMPYTVDNGRFGDAPPEDVTAWREKLGLPPDALVVLYASKLEERKHPDHLLEAFLALPPSPDGPPLHLVFVGDGALISDLRSRASERPDVHFLGFQGQTSLPSLYAMASLFVLPSSREPWGLVINEAMSAGTPALISDQVGCGPDLVIPGETGWVTPVGDIPAMTSVLDQVRADPEVAKKMGDRAQARMTQWDHEADVRGVRRALGLPG